MFHCGVICKTYRATTIRQTVLNVFKQSVHVKFGTYAFKWHKRQIIIEKSGVVFHRSNVAKRNYNMHSFILISIISVNINIRRWLLHKWLIIFPWLFVFLDAWKFQEHLSSATDSIYVVYFPSKNFLLTIIDFVWIIICLMWKNISVNFLRLLLKMISWTCPKVADFRIFTLN